ncbi:hypothetical protein NDU88_004851 [Pleurodeles waltl]|uniref:Uncharacterized protein n=1 Tax=Pleurodeles waltl TaxID=8319 RepID=A0AAV7RMF3_PLEWA|nr:hypothetical protein NDU88_004851 [Pleurodeles waltl]
MSQCTEAEMSAFQFMSFLLIRAPKIKALASRDTAEEKRTELDKKRQCSDLRRNPCTRRAPNERRPHYIGDEARSKSSEKQSGSAPTTLPHRWHNRLPATPEVRALYSRRRGKPAATGAHLCVSLPLLKNRARQVGRGAFAEGCRSIAGGRYRKAAGDTAV